MSNSDAAAARIAAAFHTFPSSVVSIYEVADALGSHKGAFERVLKGKTRGALRELGITVSFRSRQAAPVMMG